MMILLFEWEFVESLKFEGNDVFKELWFVFSGVIWLKFIFFKIKVVGIVIFIIKANK